MYCFFSSPLLSQTVTVNLCIGFILGRDIVTVKEKLRCNECTPEQQMSFVFTHPFSLVLHPIIVKVRKI